MPATRKVKLASGLEVELLSVSEVRWFNECRDAYDRELQLTLRTDRQDLDRILVHELMIFRWTQWLLSGRDYDGITTEEDAIRKAIKETSAELTKIKESMGLNKKARDAATAEGNFAAWVTDVLRRAKTFGVHRQHQLSECLTLMSELSAVIGSFDRSDAEERRKLGFESEHEILDWIRNYILPTYRKLDEYFVTHTQSFWIRDM